MEEMPVRSGNNRAMKRTAAALALVLALALPGVALAQSAGDQQYYDPLAGSSPPAPKSRARATQPPPSAPTPAPQQVAQASPQPTAAAAKGSDPSSGGQLPR